MHQINKLLISLFALLLVANSKCAYTQPFQAKGLPFPYDGQAFALNYTMMACLEYVGGDVCCNEPNAILTYNNFKQLEGVFNTESGGCDICTINLKRLWCEYACSPRQGEFLKVSSEYYEYPDPQNPGKTLIAQEANLTIEASTACALYSSCKRVPFVASVSALNTPAGFLNFQGHNAVNDARQYINVFFTYDQSKGLYFNDLNPENTTKGVTPCNFKQENQLHGFKIKGFCDCNTCEQCCDSSQGYHYSEPQVLEGFNYILVGGIWGGVLVLTVGLTFYRRRKMSKQQKAE